jgi:predicted acyltransferase
MSEALPTTPPKVISRMPPATGEPGPVSPPRRLQSLDAFRGAIMLLMASSGLGIPQVAKHFPDSAVWQFLGYQCDHTPWAGCTLWDLIQPAFMFMVGVALPWSVVNRQARGQKFGVLFGHALWRALLLVLLAVFLTSAWSRQTEWSFTNVLAQIGLGYPFLFLVAFTRPRTPWLVAFVLLFAGELRLAGRGRAGGLAAPHRLRGALGKEREFRRRV